MAGLFDVDKELARLGKQRAKIEKDLAGVVARLTNPKFLEKASQVCVGQGGSSLPLTGGRLPIETLPAFSMPWCGCAETSAAASEGGRYIGAAAGGRGGGGGSGKVSALTVAHRVMGAMLRGGGLRALPGTVGRRGFSQPLNPAQLASQKVQAAFTPPSQEYVDEAKQQQSEAAEKLAMVDAKIEQTKQLALLS